MYTNDTIAAKLIMTSPTLKLLKENYSKIMQIILQYIQNGYHLPSIEFGTF